MTTLTTRERSFLLDGPAPAAARIDRPDAAHRRITLTLSEPDYAQVYGLHAGDSTTVYDHTTHQRFLIDRSHPSGGAAIWIPQEDTP